MFQEYLRLVTLGLKNPKLVISGWLNYIKENVGNLPEEDVKIILDRRIICSTCPFNSLNAKESPEYKELFGEHYSTKRPEEHCSVCSCPLAAKTASLDDSCGLEDYNELHPNNLQILKWTSKNKTK